MQGAEIVIVGGGMVGAATAYHLAARRRARGVVLVEAGEPLGLTSAMGTEAYRHWWPDATMRAFIGRSIDLLEELADRSHNAFALGRQGYVFVTADPARAAELRAEALAAAARGEGPLREHPGASAHEPTPGPGWRAPPGLDLLDGDALRAAFPFLDPSACAALHVRRCGFLDARALGTWLIDQAVRAGARLVRDRVVGFECPGGQLRGVRLSSGDSLPAGRVILAPGPHLGDALARLGVDLPVTCELHGKAHVLDAGRVVPRGSPLMVWSDPVTLPWDPAEAAALHDDPARRRWLGPLPAGVHFRVRGDHLLLIWTFDAATGPPVLPPRFDPDFAEVLIRGLARMIPAMNQYFGTGPSCRVDGGYYCKTPDNRPLIGALPIDGAFVVGALSGYGIMGSQAAAELIAGLALGEAPPVRHDAFAPARFDDPAYAAAIDHEGARRGQL